MYIVKMQGNKLLLEKGTFQERAEHSTLCKLAHAIYREFVNSKNEILLEKLIFVLTFAQNKDRVNKYQQSMFWIISKKNVYCSPQFYYIKVGYKRYTLHEHVFLMKPLYAILIVSNSKLKMYRKCLLSIFVII